MIFINKLRQKIRQTAGVTLIELLMSIVILAVALPPLLMVLSTVAMDSNVNEVADAASYLAERELERILSQRFDAIVDEGPTNYTGNFSDYSYQVTVSAFTVSDPAAITNVCGFDTSECKRIQIDIDHANGANVYLTTIATNT